MGVFSKSDPLAAELQGVFEMRGLSSHEARDVVREILDAASGESRQRGLGDEWFEAAARGGQREREFLAASRR